MILVGVVSFGPAAILTMTSFTRIAIVLGMTRTALGTQQSPPSMVITGLALFLTFSIMSPVFSKMYDDGIQPYFDGQMDHSEAITKTITPLKNFLVRHAREKDLALFVQFANIKPPKKIEDLPTHVLIPAFLISELKTAFQIGLLLGQELS